MAFVPLGEVHRRVRAAGRRSGDLYERVPAPLVLSGQQARVGAAAAGEGEVGRGHDRPVLRRPGQANGDSLGPLLVLHRAGLSAQPLLEENATEAFDVDSAGARRSQPGGGGLTGVKGSFSGIPAVERTAAAGHFGPVRATAASLPRSTIDGKATGPSEGGCNAGTGTIGEALDLNVFKDLVRETRLVRRDTSTRSTPRARPSRTRTAPLSRSALPQLTRALASSQTGTTPAATSARKRC